MDYEIRGAGPDRRLAQLVLGRLVERVDPLSAFLYIPVDHLPEVQQLQYDVLDGFPPGVELEPVEPENLHITLLYLERVKDDDLEEFFNRLAPVMPVAFTLEVSHSGTFPEAESRPVVLHLAASPPLVRLQSELYNVAFSMGLPLSEYSKPQNFKPHISLAMSLNPPDMLIPDISAPVHIPIESFAAGRGDYERVRTIYLPKISNETVLVEQSDLAWPAPAPGKMGNSIATNITDMQDERRQEEEVVQIPIGLGDPLHIRILYDPNLDKEAQSVNTFDTFDITLGPPYYRAHHEYEQSGILARALGLDLARRLLLGPGGAHEWQRCDAMMAAPPDEAKEGYRFVFANNSLVDAVADTYAVLSVNPDEIGERNYWQASDWIGLAVTEQPDFAPVNLPDLDELVGRIGAEPVFPGVTLVVEDASEPPPPTLEELQAQEDALASGTASEDGMASGTASDGSIVTGSASGEFAVSKSDLLHLLRGGSLVYGPLRRTLTLSDGPFLMMDDGRPVERTHAPEPVEFIESVPVPAPEPDPIPIPEPGIRDRIAEVLRGFVSGLGELLGRGGPGSGHFAHEGRPGEVGGSAPSGEASQITNVDLKGYVAMGGFVGDVPDLNDEQRKILADAMREKFGDMGSGDAREAAFSFYIYPDGGYTTPLGEGHFEADSLISEVLPQAQDIEQDTLMANGFVRGFRQRFAPSSMRAQTGMGFQLVRGEVSEAAKQSIADLWMNAHRNAYTGEWEGTPNLNWDAWDNRSGTWETGTDPNEFFRMIGLSEMIERRHLAERGGPGSGHFGHQGRPGERGGSLPSGKQSATAYDPATANRFIGLWSDPKVEAEMKARIVELLSQVEQETGYRVEDVTFTSNAFAFADFAQHEYTQKKLQETGWSEDLVAEVFSKAMETSVMNFARRKSDGGKLIWINAASNFFPGPSGWEFDFYLMHEIGHEVQYGLDITDHPFGLNPPDSYAVRINSYADNKKDDEYRSDMFAAHFAGPYPGTGEHSWGSRSAHDDEYGFPKIDPPTSMTDDEWATTTDFIDLIRQQTRESVERADTRPEDLPFILKGPADGLREGINQSPEGTEAQVVDAEYLDSVAESVLSVERGGPGSGHFGHQGRPGEVGGSEPDKPFTVVDEQGREVLRLGRNMVSVPSAWDAGDFAREIKQEYGTSAHNPTHAAWIAPNGEPLAEDVDHQESAIYAIDVLSGRRVDEFESTLTAIASGMVRHTSFTKKEHAFSLPASLTKAQREQVVSIMVKIKGEEPTAAFHFDRERNGILETYWGPEAARVLGLSPDFWSYQDDKFVIEAFHGEPPSLAVRLRTFLSRITNRGGPGSGHFEHEGRPGEVGGSSPSRPKSGAGVAEMPATEQVGYPDEGAGSETGKPTASRLAFIRLTSEVVKQGSEENAWLMEEITRLREQLETASGGDESNRIGATMLGFDALTVFPGREAVLSIGTDGHIDGSALLHRSEDFIYVSQLGTLRSGIGAGLMEQVAKIAAAEGRSVHLTSVPEAEGFYRNIGMRLKPSFGYNEFYWSADDVKRIAAGQEQQEYQQ